MAEDGSSLLNMKKVRVPVNPLNQMANPRGVGVEKMAPVKAPMHRTKGRKYIMDLLA